MDLSGRHRHRILAVVPGTFPDEVVVSPDGRHIAFESTIEPEVEPFHRALYVVRRNGTHLQTLVPYRFDVGVHLGYSPRGHWLVYTRWSENPNGHEANVVLIRPNGSDEHRLTSVHRPGRSAGGATFSPDGKRIVYRFQDLNAERYWICTMRTDGSDKVRVREVPATPQANAWAPRVRPGGGR